MSERIDIISENDILKVLRNYLGGEKDVVFAFLFGSSTGGKIRKEGDIDIAIYFTPEKDIEWEAFGKRYEGENRIALEIERLLKKDIDLIVLNRARAVLADEILRNGKPIIIKDMRIFLSFLCIITDESEYVRESIISHYMERKVESIG